LPSKEQPWVVIKMCCTWIHFLCYYVSVTFNGRRVWVKLCAYLFHMLQCGCFLIVCGWWVTNSAADVAHWIDYGYERSMFYFICILFWLNDLSYYALLTEHDCFISFFLAYSLLISPIFMFSSEIIVWCLFYATDFECSYCHWQRGLSGDKKLHVFWLSFSCYVCNSSADRNNLQRVYWYVSALASMNIICLQQLLHYCHFRI